MKVGDHYKEAPKLRQKKLEAKKVISFSRTLTKGCQTFCTIEIWPMILFDRIAPEEEVAMTISQLH